MAQNFLHLSPLKEEFNSDEEEEENDTKVKSPLRVRRHSIKDTSNNNSILNENRINNIKKTIKSPKKPRSSIKMISERIIYKKNVSSKVDLCLYALANLPTKRNPEMINYIKSYLKSMPSFMNIISKEKNANLGENLIEQISIHLRHEFIPKNNLVCRYGEKGEKFYIILKGKVTFFVPKMIKCYLNFEEYINYLMQLRKNEEFELINNLVVENRSHYPIEDDNLDEYLINEYESYKKYLQKIHRRKNKSKTGRKNINYNFNKNPENNSKLQNNNDYDLNTNLKLNDTELVPRKRATLSNIQLNSILYNRNNPTEQKNKYFSYQTYKKMGPLVEKILESNNNNNIVLNDEDNKDSINSFLPGENSPKNYLKSVNVPNRDLDSNGRKLVYIYHYEEMTTFENGQTFGFIALHSKMSKRASTAIVVEDCDFGVLSKEEYIQFFELISSREKKNLYDLLRFYNLLLSISEYKFIKRFYHMFEFKKFYKNHTLLETGRPFKELLIFSQGLFVIYINVDIAELNELITKIKIIKGKLLGLSKYKIEKTLEEKRENQDLLIRKNYMSEKETKLLLKRYNYTLSIISDHLLLGYPDTVDPVTNLPLFNCICTSAESDGYSVTNKSIKFINEDSVVLNDLTDFCLMKIEYNLNRLKQFKKEILSKKKEKEISELKANINFGENIKENVNEINNNDMDININKYDSFYQDRINYINRNELDAYKNITTNKKKLFSNKLNQDKAINIIAKSKNEEMKNSLDKNLRKTYNTNNNINTNTNSNSNYDTKNELIVSSPFNSDPTQKEKAQQNNISLLRNLRQSITNKQKKLEPKNEINNQTQIINKKISIKHSLSSEAFNNNNNNEKNKNNKNSSKDNKKVKYNSINKIKSIDTAYSLNDKFISPLLSKNKNMNLLPNIKNKKKLKNFFKEETKPEDEKDKIKSPDSKKYEKNINDDLYKIDQLSFVKDKFIVFKSKREQKKERFNTVNFRVLPKINKINQAHPIKIQTQFFDDNTNEDFKKNNNITKDDFKDFEYKKNVYLKTMRSKISIKQSTMEKNINEKYNELNKLVKNLQNITKEILSKKG